ncbi:MAG TPA: hypothetical protein PKC28_09145 [Bdellovibrionales bacterium]|nr:hypothetical protein [Bdellovibrionales bacterium]
MRGIIEVSQGKPRITRASCAEITPLPVSQEEIALMPHNPGNAVHGAHVFDRLTARTDPGAGDALLTKYLCRGRYENKTKHEMQVADVMVRYKQDGKLAHSAAVIMAVYDKEGRLRETLESGDLELRNIETGVEGRVKYVTPVIGRHAITLWIDKDGEKRTGKLSFLDLPYPGRELEKDYNFRDFERVIQNLDCFAQ